MQTTVEGLPVVVRPRLGIQKQRTIYEVAGFGPNLTWGVHNNSLNNFLRGLVERVFKVKDARGQLVDPPRPERGAFGTAHMVEARRIVLRHLKRTPKVEVEQFLQYYSGRQLTMYTRAAESLLVRPLRRIDARVGSFVKAEKINLTSKPDPAPRVIQPRDPRYNIRVGQYLRPLEKPMFRAIAGLWGGQTVLKCNYGQQAQALREMWEQFDRPVAVGLDASRFDQHVSVDALRYEHSFYLRAFGAAHRHELAMLLDWQVRNRGVAYFADGRVTYEVDGCRMSGDINTSLGNCLLMCCMVWAFCQEVGVRARLANNGDDCVVIMSQRDLARFSAGVNDWFLRRGFTMVVEEPVYDFERIVFCQTSPVWTPSGWVMVRDPRVSVGKDFVSLLDLERGLGAYLGAVGQCGLASAGGLPVFNAMYSQMAAAGSHSKLALNRAFACGLAAGSVGMSRGEQRVHPYTRYSFWLAFGILPDEQEALEAYLNRHPLSKTLGYRPTKPYPVWYNTHHG